MRFEVARPVRRWPIKTAAHTELKRTLKTAEFHTEARECCEGVDDEPTAVADVVIALLGIRPFLKRTVGTDWVCHPFLFPQSIPDRGSTLDTISGLLLQSTS